MKDLRRWHNAAKPEKVSFARAVQIMKDLYQQHTGEKFTAIELGDVVSAGPESVASAGHVGRGRARAGGAGAAAHLTARVPSLAAAVTVAAAPATF